MGSLNEAMQSYAGITALTVVFLIAMLLHINASRMISHRAKIAFASCAIILTVLTVLDWFTTITNDNPAFAMVDKFAVAIMFSLAPLLPAEIAYAIFPSNRINYLAVPLAANVVLEIASALREGLVFWITPENHYERGPLYLVYVGVYAATALFLISESVRASRLYQNRNHLAMWSIAVTMFFGVAMQLVYPAIKTTWTAVAMAVYMYYHLICELRQQVDELTMLLNRRTYERFCESPKAPCVVLFFDVNDFKTINDTYGHAAGDEALRTVAEAIRKVYGSHALCYRTGGDEFAAMLTSHFDEVDQLGKRFDAEMASLRAGDPRLTDVSIGQAKAESAEEFPAAIIKADQAMYEDKQARKVGR